MLPGSNGLSFNPLYKLVRVLETVEIKSILQYDQDYPVPRIYFFSIDDGR